MPDLAFEHLSWMDVERYLQQDDRVVLVIGACEQHGYLSLLADVLIPMAIARQACQREGVLLAPPLPFGVSPYFTAYPGTLSLRPETLAIVFREIVEGLLAQGFRRILVSNGHGGNTGILSPVLIEIGTAHPDAKLVLWHSWRDPAPVAIALESAYPQYHANWQESFVFTRVGPLPGGSKAPPQIPAGASAQATRQILGDGSFGGPYQAPAEVSDRFFAAAGDAMAAELRAL